jgi:hypothetical protein
VDVDLTVLVLAGVQLGLYTFLLVWGLTWPLRVISRWLGW